MLNNSDGGKSSAPWVLLDEKVMNLAEVAAIVVSYPRLLAIPATRARLVVHWLSGRAGLSVEQVS